jgi:hypothetical protein
MDKVTKAIEDILASGLTVIERPNNRGEGKTNHLTIIGGAKRVEYWPTTGTIFADATKTMNMINVKESNTQTAIKLAKLGTLL